MSIESTRVQQSQVKEVIGNLSLIIIHFFSFSLIHIKAIYIRGCQTIPFKVTGMGIRSPNLHHEIKCCYVAVKNSNITDLRANFF